jgi:integrase
MRFLREVDDGEFSYELIYSKTNQSGEQRPENHKPLVGEAAQAMRAWLQAANITAGRIFRSITRSGRIGQSLSADAVNDIVHKRCRLAGLDGNYSAHSLRSGFVTAAAHLGAPTAQIMAASGHRSVKTLVSYTCVARADQRRLAHDMLRASSIPYPSMSGRSVPHRLSPPRSA